MLPFVRVSVSVAAAILVCLPAFSEEAQKTPEIVIEKNGAITNIRTGGTGWAGVIKAVQKLRALPADKDAQIISALQTNMNSLPPAYIYELARRTCASDPARASYLFGLAGIRVRYDIYRCVDKSAQAGLTATIMSLPLPDCKVLQDEEKSISTYKELRSSRDLFSSTASPWWVCSHGMAAIVAGLEHKTLSTSEWLKPEGEWDAIKRKIIDDYTIKKHAGE